MPALTGAGMAANHLVDDTWCPGCGLHHHVTGEHRPDCTKHPSPLRCAAEGCTSVRPANALTPVWLYANGRYLCPEHR